MKQHISPPVAIAVIVVVLALIAGLGWYFTGNRYATGDRPNTVANSPTLSPGGIRTGGSAEALSSGRPARPSADAFNVPIKK
jgi:hypothetical protein